MSKALPHAQRLSQIAYALTHGTPDESHRVCPACQQVALIYSFAVSAPPTYSLYLKCEACQAFHQFTLPQKPPNFKPELVKPEFQALEDEARQRAAQHSEESEE